MVRSSASTTCATYAKSARGVRCALWSTWEHFAVTHWGLQPLPLTVNLVRRVVEGGGVSSGRSVLLEGAPGALARDRRGAQ